MFSEFKLLPYFKNNITKYSYSIVGSLNIDTTIDYEYDKDNYIIESNMVQEKGSFDRKIKNVYQYY